jgi:hypothetical protein
VPAVRTFRPYPNRTERQRDVVGNDDHLFDRPIFLFQKAAYGLAAQIHIGLGLCELDCLIFNFHSPHQRAALFAFDQRMPLVSKQIHEHKAEIMPRLFILGARISQANHEPVLVHAKLFFCAAAFSFFGGSFLANDLGFGTGLKLRLELGLLNNGDRCDNRLGALMDFDTFPDL